MKLSKTSVAGVTLPPKKTEIICFDDDLPGFGVRLRAGGSRCYIFQYKIGAKHRRLTIGKCSALDFAQARKQASDLHAKVRLGEDPAGAKAESRSRAEETFRHCLKAYLAWQRARVRQSTFTAIERHLVKNLASLHRLRIDKIDRRAIALQLGRIATRGSLVQANRTRAQPVKVSELGNGRSKFYRSRHPSGESTNNGNWKHVIQRPRHSGHPGKMRIAPLMLRWQNSGRSAIISIIQALAEPRK